jgi:hypothetical protein
MSKFKLSFVIAAFVLSLLTATSPALAQFNVDNNRRYDQNSFLEAHDAYTTPSQHYIEWLTANQDRDITDQLKAGVRSLDLRIWMVRQKKVGCNPQAIIYNNDGDKKQTLAGDAGDVSDADKEIVLGHHIWDTGYGHIIGNGVNCGGTPYYFEGFDNRLGKIKNWMDDNPSAVVTLNVGNDVPEKDAFRVRDALSSEIGLDRIFVIGNFYVNTGMPHPQGRPGGLRPKTDGWYFPMDGLPTLQNLIDNNRRVVYLPDGQTFDNTGAHDVYVDTVYSEKSVPSGCNGEHDDKWSNANSGSQDIDDVTRPLFMMQHVHSTPEPTHDQTKCVQDIKWLKNKLSDIFNRWHRLPNLVRVDHAAKTTETGGASNSFSGPKDFVSYLNDLWAQQLKVIPTWNPSTPPTSSGWNNADVTVYNMWGAGDNITSVVYSVFGPPRSLTIGSLTLKSTMPFPVVDRKMETSPATYTVTGEGKHVISFYAVGSSGNASDRGYIDIWIDKTAPVIDGRLNSSANAAGWYNADVSAGFTYRDVKPAPASDNIPYSDIDPKQSTPSVTLSTEGANQTITGVATDGAGNVSTRPFMGINLDKTSPAIRYSGNSGSYTIDQSININCAASDNLSGVLTHNCQNIVGDAYNFPLGTNTYSASATDVADNVGNGATSFEVIVNTSSLSNLTARFVTNAGIANSLSEKLRVAAQFAPASPPASSLPTSADSSVNLKKKEHHIDLYVKEVNLHTGRFITAQNAAILIRLARAM